jgi:hypothetical protein
MIPELVGTHHLVLGGEGRVDRLDRIPLSKLEQE